MKTVVLAYNNIGCEGIRALLRNGYDIRVVFTHRDDPNENTWFESVAEVAASLGLPVYTPDDINNPLWVEKIRKLQPDILFSFYYRNMVAQPILEIPKQGCMNLHGSLLPKYRGRAPINWVLVNGEKETGVSLHYMTPKADDGDIVAQEAVAISEDDTAKSLSDKLTQITSSLLDAVLPQIKRGLHERIPQDHSVASYFGGRKPADGLIDWKKSAREIRNLVRAVTRPYPGAFTYLGAKKCTLWKVSEVANSDKSAPGTIISTEPLQIASGNGALKVELGEIDGQACMNGHQIAAELCAVSGMSFGDAPQSFSQSTKKKRVLILGVDGFIGNALSERLLDSGKYEVHGMDLNSKYVERLFGRPDFHFSEGDISIHREWIEYHVRKCDIVLPLVAIATPIEYTRNPLRVFELDFEENLRIVRYCSKYKKRIIFPSTSEVYGMCEEEEFDEDNSKLVLGPIRMQRWIYSCCKQLLDRVIWAYGQKEGLQFSLFRPFNWIGPRLDSLESARIGSSRAITQLILNLVEGSPIQLIDGGNQRRCFTDIVDGVECLFRIIENKNDACNGQIVNIGNPDNEASIKELSVLLTDMFEKHPLRSKFPPLAGMREIESGSYYGRGYQDTQHRRPSIRNAKKLLNWEPTVELRQSIETTLDYFLKEAAQNKK